MEETHMMRIEAFAMDRFRNMEELGFFLEVNGQINKLLTGEMEAKVVNDFQTAMDEYNCALRQRRSSEETAVMKEIDNQIKKLYSGMVLMVQSLMLHPSEGKRTMAEPVQHIIDKFGGFYNKSIASRHTNIDRILNEMEKLGEQTLQTLDLQPWIEALRTALQEYKLTQKSQISNRAKYKKGWSTTSRQAAEEAYNNLTSSINALYMIYNEERYAQFIRHINTIIAHQKANFKSRATRSENKKEDPTEPETPDTPETPEGGTTPETSA